MNKKDNNEMTFLVIIVGVMVKTIDFFRRIIGHKATKKIEHELSEHDSENKNSKD